MAHILKPIGFVAAMALAQVGPQASAQYLETTALPMVEDWGAEVVFEGPRPIPGGQRWEDVVLRFDDGGAEVRLDWVEEVATDSGVRVRVSPEGRLVETRGTDTPPADLRFDGLVWEIDAVETQAVHRVLANGLEVSLTDPREGAFRAFTGRLDLEFMLDRRDILGMRSGGQIEEMGLGFRNLDEAGEQFDIWFRDLVLRQETEIPAQVWEMIEQAERGDEPDPREVLEALRARGAMTFALGEMEVRGRFIEGEVPGRFGGVMEDLTGAVRFDGELDMASSAELRFDTLSIDVDSAAFGGEMVTGPVAAEFDMNLSREALEEMIAAAESGAEPGAEVLGGLDVMYEFRNEGAQGDFRFDADGFAGEGRFEAQSGREALAFRAGKLEMSSETNGLTVEGNLPMISPDEMRLSLGQTRYRIDFPFVPAPDGGLSKAAFQLFLRDYTASDNIWALADPGALIPRDPITFALDLEAVLRVLQPIFGDIEPDEAMELQEVTLRELTLRGGGAEILGEGGGTVDLSGGVPRGDARLELSINGLIGLSGAVAQLGLVPPEALLGLRGALGAFAKPVGEDAFLSEIVISPDGTITANGFPLPLD